MGKLKYEITKTEYQNVMHLRKIIKNKAIDRKLRVIMLRYEGYKNTEISEITEYTPNYIAKLLKQFKEMGLKEYSTSKNVGGNHRLISEEKEDELLSNFEQNAKKGQILSVNEIKKLFDEEIGKETYTSYIYRLLHRKGYRKIMKKQTSKKSKWRGDRSLKKINDTVKKLENDYPNKKVRLMFEDEAGFGRINKPKYCWSKERDLKYRVIT